MPRNVENNCLDETKLNPNHSYRYSGPKKPPFTYTELIEHALNEKGELTVSGIYRWISYVVNLIIFPFLGEWEQM